MTSTLEQLKTLSTVVADTADVDAIDRFQPIDATTNPSLVLKQATTAQAAPRMRKAKAQVARGDCTPAEAAIALACDFGADIASRIPGYVSTEVDARLSFDTEASIAAGRDIIARYQSLGIASSRILIKLAATWEGIEAARVLEAEGIGCNLTLVFSEIQAIAAAQAKATLISPFVGRIFDWYVARGEAPKDVNSDPGVLSVARIVHTYRAQGFQTIVMGASFRSAEQVMALAGCDRLTIAPNLLEALSERTDRLTPLPQPPRAEHPLPRVDRSWFALTLARDAMANEKLADGITRFIDDQIRLESLLRG